MLTTLPTAKRLLKFETQGGFIKNKNVYTFYSQGLIQKGKVHINCEKGAQISILTNKIATQ